MWCFAEKLLEKLTVTAWHFSSVTVIAWHLSQRDISAVWQSQRDIVTPVPAWHISCVTVTAWHFLWQVCVIRTTHSSHHQTFAKIAYAPALRTLELFWVIPHTLCISILRDLACEATLVELPYSTPCNNSSVELPYTTLCNNSRVELSYSKAGTVPVCCWCIIGDPTWVAKSSF